MNDAVQRAKDTPATVAGTAHAAIPFKQEPGLQSANVPLTTIGFLLVLGVGWWWLRRQLKLGRSAGPGPRARVLESHRLGPRGVVAVVEFGGQWHLIAQTEHTVTCIAQSAPREAP